MVVGWVMAWTSEDRSTEGRQQWGGKRVSHREESNEEGGNRRESQREETN